jgi:hypothetical protein
MGWFSRSIALEVQLAALAEVGLRVNAGVTEEDLCAFGSKSEMEKHPYEVIVDVLGIELERDPFTPICDRLWMCDLERVEDHGAYRDVVERLELMTGGSACLAKITDFVDVEGGKAWVEFEIAGLREHWDMKVDNDWLDPQILKRYDDLLDRMHSTTRLFINTRDYGQAVMLGAFTDEQKAAFERLTKKNRLVRLADARL